jgi:hypothetical protein
MSVGCPVPLWGGSHVRERLMVAHRWTPPISRRVVSLSVPLIRFSDQKNDDVDARVDSVPVLVMLGSTALERGR